MMRIEKYISLSVKMNVIEVKLAQDHRKVWAVFGNYEDCEKFDEKLRYFLCPLSLKVYMVSRL